MAITNKYFLDEQGLSTVANHIKERLKTVSTMPAVAGNGTVLLYTGATSGSYTNGHIYQYSTTTNSWVDISPSGGDLSNYIQKSSTAGLVKNDGSIDTTTYISDVSSKADKVTGAINGNLAGLDSNGNLVDSGILATNVIKTSDVIDNLTTYNRTKPLSAYQGTELNSKINNFSYCSKDIVKETVGWASINLLHISSEVTTQTINGITFTITRNSDGEVTQIDLSGIASADTTLQLWNATDAETFRTKGDYYTEYLICNYGSWGQAGIHVGFSYYDEDYGYTLLFETDSSSASTRETSFNVRGIDCKCYIRIENGTNCNDKYVKPMIRYATIASSDFYPYHESVVNYIDNLELNDLSNVNISSPLNDQVLKYDSVSGKWINGSGGGGGGHTMLPTPSASVDLTAIKTAIAGAVTEGGTNDDVPSLNTIGLWSNTLTKTYIILGSSGAIGTTGIGTWSEDGSDQTGWITISDLANVASNDDIDVKITYDPECSSAIVLGGYIIDTTTCKMCIGFANELSIADTATARIGIEIIYKNSNKTIIGS